MYTHVGESKGGSATAAGDCAAATALSPASTHASEALAKSWANRVAVRIGRLDRAYCDCTIPDYPPAMVPFRDDPHYGELDDAVKRKILAAAWVSYNEKTIGVEKSIVAPACELLLGGAFAGVDS